MMIETMTSIDVFILITKTSIEGMGITMRSGSEDVVKKRSEGGERKKSEG